MPRFACPVCKSIISATQEQRGTVLACSSCGKKIRVPSAKPAEGAQAAPASPRRDPDSEAVAQKAAARPPIQEEGEDIPVRRKPRREEEEVAVRATPPKLRTAPKDDDEDEDRVQARPKPPQRPKRPQEDDEDDDREPLEEEDQDDDDDEDRPRRKKKKKRQEGSVIASVGGFIGTIGGILMIILFVMILSGRAPRWLMDFIEQKLRDNGIPPLLAVGITAGLFLVPVGLWILVTLKGTILAAMPDELEFRPAKMSKFPDLETDTLEQLTEQFEELGFEQVMDYTVTTELEVFPSGFARLLKHDDENCYAEINQAFTPAGDAVPMRCLLVSHLEDGWSLMTTDRTPTKESYLMRRPRAVWRSLPDKEPEDLLVHHRKMRKKMMKSLEVDFEGPPSKEAYFKREKAANRERKEVIRGRWTLGILLEFAFFERNPKYEWLGEFEGALD